MNVTDQKRHEKITEQAIEYMNEKYGIDFVPLSYNISDYLSEIDTVECYTEGMDPKRECVTVYIVPNEDGYSYRDNYYYYRLREDMEKYMETYIDSVFSDNKVFVSNVAAGETASLSANCTIDDVFMKNPAICLTASVFISHTEDMEKEVFDNRIKTLAEKLLETNKNYVIVIMDVPSEQYDKLNREVSENLNKVYIKKTHGNIGIQDKEREMIIQARRISIQSGEITIK